MFEANEDDLTIDAIKEKYHNDPEKAWEALLHSQKHIPRIEAENREYKTKVATAKTLEEVLAAIKTGTQNSQVPPILPNPSANVENNEAPNIEDAIAAYLGKQRQEEAERKNREEVARHFTELFKDKASERFTAVAQEAGFSPQEFEALAARNPKAVLKLAGLGQSNMNQSPTKGSVNPEALKGIKGVSGQPGTRSYYENLRKTNHDLWKTNKIQNEILAAHDRNPDFYMNN